MTRTWRPPVDERPPALRCYAMTLSPPARCRRWYRDPDGSCFCAQHNRMLRAGQRVAVWRREPAK